MSEPVESRIARIESHVEHINEVTTDLRVELRRTNDRMDAGFQKIDNGHKELCEKIAGGDKELGSACKELYKRIDDVHHNVRDRIDGLSNKLHSMAIWALLLYVTLAGGLLTVIARSFKWF